MGAYDDLVPYLDPDRPAWTSDFRNAMEESDIDNIKFHNIIDPARVGEVRLTNQRPGNYLKSLRNNNGMFDQSKVGIFKSLAAPIAAGTAASTQNEKGGILYNK